MPRYIGKEIGGYRVMEAIGAGGMAKVYKAYQAAFDRFVALKILPETYAEDETYVARFIQEAKIIAKLEHKHILPVYDFGEEDKIAYLSMRYLQAGTLKDLIGRAENNKLPLGDTVRIVNQIAEALQYAHQQKIVHRDIKPSNILIDTHGDTFLMDFGIAKILDQTSHLTKTGGAIGTPAYMSPEQGSGKDVDGRSDVYSLGIILYQMMVGHVPYQADTPMAVMLAHFSEPLPIPSSLNPDIPEAIEKVILKSLAKDPEHRFQSAGEMGFALQQAVGNITLTPSTGILQLSGDLAVDMTPAEVTHDDRQLMKKLDRQIKVKRFMPWVSGIFIIGLIVAVGYLLSNNGQVDFEQAAAMVQEVTDTAEAKINATQAQERAEQNAESTQKSFERNLTQTVVALTPSATDQPTQIPDLLNFGEIVEICNLALCIINNEGKAVSTISLSDQFDFLGGKSKWSPDGTKILFYACEVGTRDSIGQGCENLYYYDIESQSVFTLYENYGTATYSFGWSPNGEWIAFNQHGVISIIRPDGSDEKILVSDTLSTPIDILWSPDSSKIIWGAEDSSGYFVNSIWFINIDGSDKKILYQVELGEGIIDQKLAWTPDGSHIVFTMNNGKSYQLNIDCEGDLTGCDKSSLEEIIVVPNHWLPNYYPQWNIEFVPYIEGKV